jgi:hypothetical protein
VPLGREADALDELDRLGHRKPLRVVVMRHAGQASIEKLDPPAIDDRAVARDRDQHGPAGMVRNADHRFVHLNSSGP